MSKILIVGSDETFRNFLSQKLQDTYEVSATSDPQEALAMVLEVRPDCILLDWKEGEQSSQELCHRLNSLSVTKFIPIFVIAGETSDDLRALGTTLGVNGFVDK